MFKKLLLAALLGIMPSMGQTAATYSRVKTWSSGETLTASDLNAEFNNILTNGTTAGLDDYSATATEMRVVTDPYPAAAESLATSLQGELERIRYQILEIKKAMQASNVTYWYQDLPTAGIFSIVGTDIGVGDTTPDAMLDVAGTGRFDGTVTMVGAATVGTTLGVTGVLTASGGISQPNNSGGWDLSSYTWTYLSATTFIATGDKLTDFTPGMKVKLTQTSDKYFYVVSVASGATTSTVTVTAGTSYTLANAAITSPYTSRVSQPQSFPGEFSYTPAEGAGWSGTPTTVGLFSIQDRIVDAYIYGTGTSDAGTANLTLPITAGTVATWEGLCKGTDNGTALATPCGATIVASGTTVETLKSAGTVAWTSSGTKTVYMRVRYSI